MVQRQRGRVAANGNRPKESMTNPQASPPQGQKHKASDRELNIKAKRIKSASTQLAFTLPNSAQSRLSNAQTRINPDSNSSRKLCKTPIIAWDKLGPQNQGVILSEKLFAVKKLATKAENEQKSFNQRQIRPPTSQSTRVDENGSPIPSQVDDTVDSPILALQTSAVGTVLDPPAQTRTKQPLLKNSVTSGDTTALGNPKVQSAETAKLQAQRVQHEIGSSSPPSSSSSQEVETLYQKWSTSLQPYHKSFLDTLSLIAQGQVRHLLTKEEALYDVENEYKRGISKALLLLVAKRQSSCENFEKGFVSTQHSMLEIYRNGTAATERDIQYYNHKAASVRQDVKAVHTTVDGNIVNAIRQRSCNRRDGGL